jgi:hypothetical protein
MKEDEKYKRTIAVSSKYVNNDRNISNFLSVFTFLVEKSNAFATTLGDKYVLMLHD